MTPFTQRPPSSQWEPSALPGMPQSVVWLWVKPGGANEVIVSVPPDTHSPPWNPAAAAQVTARALAAAAGLDATQLAGWTTFGQTFDAHGGQNPLLDHPVPPTPGTPVQVTFAVSGNSGGPPPAAASSGTQRPTTSGQRKSDNAIDDGLLDVLAAAPPAPIPAGAAPAAWTPGPTIPTREAVADPTAKQILSAIESDWNAIQQLERQLLSVTKQLNAMQGKLQSLNRDLNPMERIAADSNDVKDWNDARRFLRDRIADVSKQIRAFDIGTVSSAGDRRRLEDTYAQYVRQKRPFPNMAATAQQFEAHRKTCQNLLTQSGAALSKAQADGEGKARQVLQRIAKKARDKRAKR